jgi:aspartate racemase
MRTIGILGGSSDQATADYYRQLNLVAKQRLGGYHTAEILINSLDFALAERWVRTAAWQEAGADLHRRALSLERAGAELLLCVSNTLHRCAEDFTAGLSIPFLHIADPTGGAIRAAGLRRVALLGTLPVMSTDYSKRRYREHFGIEIVVPTEGEQSEIDRIIFDELCQGRFLDASRVLYLRAIESCLQRGAEGVILGCTEIPLLIRPEHLPGVPQFDTTALHVSAAIDWALTPDNERWPPTANAGL